jgi:predicted nucleic acid-binding protein
LRRLVVDASVWVELLTSDRSASWSARLRGDELHVPALCDIEVAACLQRGTCAPAARAALAHYSTVPLHRHAHLPLLPRIHELRHWMPAADACYVALAEALEATFLTRDAQLGRTVRAIGTVPCERVGRQSLRMLPRRATASSRQRR